MATFTTICNTPSSKCRIYNSLSSNFAHPQFRTLQLVSQPAPPSRPSQPAQPSQPSQPGQPSQGSPAQPVQPASPAQPSQPGPAQPAQTGQPGQPSHQLSQPTQPAQTSPARTHICCTTLGYSYVYKYVHLCVAVHTNIYYTSVNPCISMHRVKQNRVMCNRVQCHRAQLLRAAFSNATANSTLERQVANMQCLSSVFEHFRASSGADVSTERHF